MKNKRNQTLYSRRERKTDDEGLYSLRHQKRAAHKEVRVQARNYLQAVALHGVWTEVDYV